MVSCLQQDVAGRAEAFASVNTQAQWAATVAAAAAVLVDVSKMTADELDGSYMMRRAYDAPSLFVPGAWVLASEAFQILAAAAAADAAYDVVSQA